MAKPRSKFKKVKWLFGKEIEIPEEWEITAQGHICQFINGYAYSQSEFREKGYSIIRIQNLTGGKNFVFSDIPLPEKQFAVNGDLLFAWSATFGPFIWHGYKAAFHYHQWKVIPSDKISKIFLYYHFTKIAPTVKQMGQSGLGMFHMTKSGMEKFPIALPPPSEQTKIASILSGVDALIESTQKVIEKIERLKKGLMQKLLTKGIGHTKFKKVQWHFEREIKIPEEWVLQKFDEVVKTNPPTKIKQNIVPYIPMDAVDTEKPSFNYFEERRLSKNSSLPKFQNNDVLFARITPSTENGKTSIVENFRLNGVASSELTVLRASKMVLPRYLYYYVKSYRIRQFAISQMMGTTGRQRVPNSVFKKVLNFELPPLSEQQKIASILSSADAYIQKNQEYKKKMELLKKGLMQKLLTGQIRVKADH